MSRAKMIPEHINSLADYIEETFSTFSDRPAYSALGQTKTFAEMDVLSAKFAAWLQSHTSLKPGDRIAVQLPNLIQHPIAVYGALRVGLVIVNTNPLYTEREMEHQFKDSGAKALVILSDLLPKFENIKAHTDIQHVIVTSAPQLLTNTPVGHDEYPCYSQIFKQAEGLSMQARPAAHLDDTCILQYTGGTTGVSKGAELTHQNVLANSLQTLSRLGKALKPGEEVVVCPLPLYHIYAFTVCMMTFFAKGAMVLLIPNPRDIDGFVTTLKGQSFTAFAGINTLFMGLCAHPDFKNIDFTPLRLTMSGGTALTRFAADLWQETTACSVTEGYGLSETSPVVAFNIPGHETIGTVGPALEETEIALLDQNDDIVPAGEAGQIAVRGPQVMKGYWKRNDKNNEVMTKDGFFKTGDVGEFTSDNCLKIVDRLKDMIIVSGFNVYPNEVEDILTLHDDVLEAAVVGKSDSKTQERVCAFITVNGQYDQKSLLAHCRKHLTAYKVPKEIHVLEELPKSSVGKILRRELRDK